MRNRVWRGKLVRVPAAAEGFEELDAARHLLLAKIERSALIGEERGLRGDHVEVGIDVGTVTGVG